MNIVVEGADNSGKSTLVDVLARGLNWEVMHSPGPTNKEALNRRVYQSLTAMDTIFDRHPVVSERIYGTARGNVMTLPDLEMMFYRQSNIIIYCRGQGQVHIEKEHDTPEHLELINTKALTIQALYDQWALQHASIIHRLGESPVRVFRFVMGELRPSVTHTLPR